MLSTIHHSLGTIVLSVYFACAPDIMCILNNRWNLNLQEAKRERLEEFSGSITWRQRSERAKESDQVPQDILSWFFISRRSGRGNR